MLTSRLFKNIFGRIKYDPAKDEFNRNTWPLEHSKEEWIIESDDHLELKAWLYRNPSAVYVIFNHGYHADISTQGDICEVLHDQLGWNVLLISPRGTGISQGEYITFGAKERYDLAAWAWELSRREPESKIVLMGWSMGAHTVMGALGLELPSNVIAAVSDSGYIRPDDQIKLTIKARHPWILFPDTLISSVDRYCHSDYDFSVHYSILGGLQLNHVPVLFVHGRMDSLVPCSCAAACYEANFGEKQLMIVDQAGHCESFYKERSKYIAAVSDLVEKHI